MKFYKYLIENISKNELDKLENWADKLFSSVNIDVEFTKHFFQRLNNKRNKKEIKFEELRQLFKDTHKKYGKKIPELGKNAEAVIRDMRTDINVPFVLLWDSKTQEFDLISKTIVRKKIFKTRNKQFILN